MQFPNDQNGDVFRRMHASGFDFSKPHNVEFFAVFRTEEDADRVAREFVADHRAGDTLVAVDTSPHEVGGMALKIVKSMLVTHRDVTAFEALLAQRAGKYDSYVDGWGVLQE